MTPPTLLTTHRLGAGQFHSEQQPKSLIMLHHTVGGSAASTFRWWEMDPRVVGTAYIVERDGRVFEVFPPAAWAWHIGVKDSAIERRSIGIELASEGALEERLVDGRRELWAFGTGPQGRRLGVTQDLVTAQRVVRFPDGYRGYEWFDAYEPAQVDATLALVRWLCDRFGIPRRLPLSCFQPDGEVRRWFDYSGVLHHAMVRPDKSDLHPAFPFARLAIEALQDPDWKTGGTR